MAIQSVNPATGELLKEFEEISVNEVNNIIADAHDTFTEWRKTSFSHRAELLSGTAKHLRAEKEKYARIITTEMGKIISESIAEVEKCAWVCDYYAENAEKILAKEVIDTDAAESFVQFDPVGVILAVMPWNFPYWQVFRFAAPALMAGNVGILKHASNVPQCALAIEEMFRNGGFPENAFRTLLAGSGKVEMIMDNDLVRAATLTGSEPAGAALASISGKRIKKTVLELGGSDPFIILEDADLKEAAKTGAKSRMINNGQSCIAAKRFIVVDKIAKDFEKLFTEEMKSFTMGDPILYEIGQGPMARADLRDELHEQVKETVSGGAKIITGGEPVPGKGAYYPATVLTGIEDGMTAYREELFGPVGSIIRAKNEEEAIRIANDSEFGLSSSLWTTDMDKAKSLAHDIDSGAVFVNGLSKSDPRLPFGGVKRSGYGRELASYGIKEFVNIKSVWVK